MGSRKLQYTTVDGSVKESVDGSPAATVKSVARQLRQQNKEQKAAGVQLSPSFKHLPR